MCVCTCVCVRFGSLFTGLPIITFTVRINPWETLAQMESSGTVPLPRLSLPFLATSNILSLSLSLFDVYPVHSRTYVWKMFFNRSTEASSILWISYAGDAYYASRGARGEGNIYRDISIGKFTGGRWWNDEVRGRLSWKEFEAHSSMWNSILYFLDRYPFAIGGGGDANIWKTIYSGKRWILSINIIARSRIFGLRRKNFSREIFASFLIPGFFFNSSEFFEIFFSYPPPLNCLNSWWNIIIIETWLSTLPGSSFSCSSLVPVCLCLAKGICERTDWNAKSKRTDRECVWLIVNCWLEQLVSYETTEDRRRARNRDLHHGNIDIVVCSREERFR